MLQDGDYATEREILVRTLEACCKALRFMQNPGSREDFVQAKLDALMPKNRDDAIAGATSRWVIPYGELIDPSLAREAVARLEA
jgi:hypothetical protein